MPKTQVTLPHSALVAVRTITATQPLQWLTLAWHDMTRAGWISYAHGVLMALAGAMMLMVAGERFWFMAGAFSGF